MKHFIKLGPAETYHDPIINVQIPADDPIGHYSDGASTFGKVIPSKPGDLLVDGIHRLCAMWLMMQDHVQMYRVPLNKARRPLPGFGSVPGMDWGEENYLEKRGIKSP